MTGVTADLVVNGFLSAIHLVYFPYHSVPVGVQVTSQVISTCFRMVIGRFDFSQTERDRALSTWAFTLCITSIAMLALYPRGRAAYALRAVLPSVVLLSVPQMAAHLISRIFANSTAS